MSSIEYYKEIYIILISASPHTRRVIHNLHGAQRREIFL